MGRRDNTRADYRAIAAAYVLKPSQELGQVLREQLIGAIGARQINNYWRPLGIHEGEFAMAFMEAYDLATAAGLLTEEDRKAVGEEMKKCAHFLEGWTLDNRFSQYWPEYRRTYCLNFHIFASAMMGVIAMNWPEWPESAAWLRQAQSALPSLLFTEFGEDGGYGEGSVHYWHPTFRALFQFMLVSRNLGVHDYFADPAVADALRRTLAWRMALTSPDGRTVAVGDSDRSSLGAEYLMQSGAVLNEPTFVWTGRTIAQRARDKGIPSHPYYLFYHDAEAKSEAPTALFNNMPYSGYATFRSGWGPEDNYFLLKYGTSYIGRRENEDHLVISGHAHADALQLELHHRGIPILVDPGRLGRYRDYMTYGGYCKATVAHNTVGLGNPWGYSRLDGRYAEHVKKHGPDFLYEVSQDNIGRADSQLDAIGDAGQINVVSAELQTYKQVTHQRTVFWFRDTGIAVVGDRMRGDKEEFYEWYLNPIGKLLAKGSVLTYGDDKARLDVIPVLPRKAEFEFLAKGDANVPPYYVSLVSPPPVDPSEKPANRPYQVEERWGNFSLLVEKYKAKTTQFLNILIPYTTPESPFQRKALGESGVQLDGSNSRIFVSAGANDDKALFVDGELGVVRQDGGALASYGLHHGHGLKLGNENLLKMELLSQPWAPWFDGAVTAVVSLPDRRASFSFPPTPSDRQLIMNNPKIIPGEEPALPISVAVSFRVNEKPQRIIALRSITERPEINDPAFEQKTAPWKNDPHQKSYLRKELDFTYDEGTKMATVQLDAGIQQIIWQ